jgi:hypothetical protein
MKTVYSSIYNAYDNNDNKNLNIFWKHTWKEQQKPKYESAWRFENLVCKNTSTNIFKPHMI